MVVADTLDLYPLHSTQEECFLVDRREKSGSVGVSSLQLF